ncbi:MAG: DUF3293 domain-containing protein [Verrucomicrobiota bacterium]
MKDFPEPYLTTRFVLSDPPQPLPASFAIVTAFNPMDEVRPEAANHEADQKLKTLLEERRASFFRATGTSPDLAHQEPGWAVMTDRPSALEIGRHFGQRAIWWIEDDDLHLLSCQSSDSLLLGSFLKRIHEP